MESELPGILASRKLAKNFALLKAASLAYARNELPSEYYVGLCDPSATGRVPKDVMVLCNLDFCISEYRKEIEKRLLAAKGKI